MLLMDAFLFLIDPRKTIEHFLQRESKTILENFVNQAKDRKAYLLERMTRLQDRSKTRFQDPRERVARENVVFPYDFLGSILSDMADGFIDVLHGFGIQFRELESEFTKTRPCKWAEAINTEYNTLCLIRSELVPLINRLDNTRNDLDDDQVNKLKMYIYLKGEVEKGMKLSLFKEVKRA